MPKKTGAKAASIPPPPPVKKKSKRAPSVSELRRAHARRASTLLKQVSDPTRLQVILLLAEGQKHVGALVDEVAQSQPAVSHHLALLRHGGIIAPRRQGKQNFYSLTETGGELAKLLKSIVG
jgi:DNA-binding transcriptional ArsR family regulator